MNEREQLRLAVIARTVDVERFDDGSWRVYCRVCGSTWVGHRGSPPAGHPRTAFAGDGGRRRRCTCPLVKR